MNATRLLYALCASLPLIGCVASAKPYDSDLPSAGCAISGCARQLCVEATEYTVGMCAWEEYYACYQRYGECTVQADNKCGWTQSPVLLACLSRFTPMSLQENPHDGNPY